MTKHTPGPWAVGKVKNKKQKAYIDAELHNPVDDPLGCASWNGLAVAYGSTFDTEKGREVMLANARLIAAAPDLLAAVKGYMAWADPEICHDDELNAILESFRAAIAKATGGE